jgi:uncharacterized membrane protein YbhN (UPF0104 family)
MAITLVDRAISVLSIIVVGALVYAVSSKTRPVTQPIPPAPA